MTSFTKHRRQPTGKSLVRPKLKVTCLLGSVQADLLQNGYVYFWSLKSGHCQKMIAESPCYGIVNYKQMTALSVWCFPSVPHPPMVLPSLRISSRAQMWECRHAESQLAAPATTQSAFWNMAFFSVYWFLSRPNLIWGNRGGGNHSSGRPSVPNSSGDRSGEMHEFHMGGVWHKSAFENVGWIWLKRLQSTVKHIAFGVPGSGSDQCAVVLFYCGIFFSPFPFWNIRITYITFL